MVFIYFLLAAAVTVFAAIKLSQYADVISEKSAMGGMMVGTLLLAGATSLPEISTSFSAAAIGNADIAVGNMVGSNLFNLFILAGFDLMLNKRRLLDRVSKDHTYSSMLGIFLTVLLILALWIRTDVTVLGIGLDALAIGLAYVIGMFVINKLPNLDTIELDEEPPDAKAPKNPSAHLSPKHAGIRFVIFALIIMAAGTALSITGDEIAVVTGIGSSFVGSFLVAAATSLPEAISVFVALRLSNVNMAVGAILGSNIFNMVILALSDPVYTEGSILAEVSGANMIMAVAVLIMSVLTLFSLFRSNTKSTFAYSIPSILVLALYFIASYLNFTY
ncbi:sodium:calcium antiporter [Planococcus sp. CP5-4]|uniref:sodium:calcium antiporter n=1 Tax=unclassified Planococcus (in: firmicutes) TaxID=2662419 RepID=UPI001C212CAC|nr:MULTISPECIES: sodium:calcium antiporter [unclassified Planococcus (in: firmicutes)]MBU9674150.1 sodium:calcium antiporter [Planococcus sp. CP5-4_YE]MBV0910031.1 sodium:calcium antiporter [Planococcus sp. CP5-4_UN]MBW6064565.1 sodium:calcium antiporter [Planococcus sp. CP5-4]